MSTATMDVPSTPMQVEVDVSIGNNSASKDSANKAEETSAQPADKRECTSIVNLILLGASLYRMLEDLHPG